MVHAVSERLGITAQAVSAVFKKDDASLAWVEKVAAAYGFQLRLVFPEVTFSGAVLQSRVETMEFPNAGNLAGLLECVRQKNLTIHALSCMMHISPHTVMRAFETGDMKISLLKRMARSLHIDIRWDWTQLESNSSTRTTEK